MNFRDQIEQMADKEKRQFGAVVNYINTQEYFATQRRKRIRNTSQHNEGNVL
jgi:hypothetical protein